MDGVQMHSDHWHATIIKGIMWKVIDRNHP